MEVRDRHVLVTGASRGLGASMAAAFARGGARVTAAARSEEELVRVATPLGAAHVVVDLAEPAAPPRLVLEAEAANGPVDVLVNNAAAEAAGIFSCLDEAVLADAYQVNLVSPALLCRLVLPGMLERGSGHLVNVSSLAGGAALPGASIYSSSKAGLTRLSAALRRELRSSGVGVTSVELGPVQTGMLDRGRASTSPASASFRRLYRIGMVTTADVDEVARCVVRAVERDRAHVRLPRRTAPIGAIGSLPQALFDVATIGVPRN